MLPKSKTKCSLGLKPESGEGAALFQELPIAAYVLQADRFVAFNAAAVELLGHPEEDIRSANYWELCEGWAQPDVRERGRAWLRGSPFEPHGLCPVVSDKGERRWIEVFRRRIEFAGAPALLVTAIDLTERWAWLDIAKRTMGRDDGPLPSADHPARAERRPRAERPLAAALKQPLTRRQAEVLELVARGRSNKQIARDLGITEGTAKLHVFSLMRAYQVPNRTMLAVIAHSPAEATGG